MPAWPTDICPLAGSFKETVPDNTIRSDMDRGPAKVRRRTTANVRGIQFRSLMTAARTAELDDFYVNVTFSGSIPFDYIHPRTKQTVQARFTSPPTYSDRKAGQFFETEISLEILP